LIVTLTAQLIVHASAILQMMASSKTGTDS
jgi:hypothetical protein